MKKLIAMLGAVVAAVTSAFAATVTFVEGSTTDFIVINSTGNAGNYSWDGYNNAFGIKIPAAEGLAEGTKVYLKALTFVKGSGSQQLASADVPNSITVGGYTVNKDESQQNDGLGGNTDRQKVIYAFAEGSRPLLTVGTVAQVTTTGLVNLRALPTSRNADSEDPLIVILNNTEYQPVAKVEASIVPHVTTAEITTDTEGVDTITWSNGDPSAENPGVLTIGEGVTLSVADLSSLSHVTLAGAGTLRVTSTTTLNRTYTSPVEFGAEWSGTLHLVGVTMAYADFNKFAGVGKIKLTGAAGYFDNEKVFPGQIILVDDGETVALNVNNGDSAKYYKIAKLSGGGTLKVTGTTTSTQQTVIADSSEFTGTVIVAEANNKKSVLFGHAAEFSPNAQGSIIVATAVTIPASKTWTARNRIIINSTGTLTMSGSTESTITGSGKLTGYTAFSQVTAAVKTSLQAVTWTGSLVITGSVTCEDSNHCTKLNDYGNVGSKIEFGNCTGYMSLAKNNGSELVKILPEIVIAGNVALNDGFSENSRSPNYFTYIRKLSGTGTLRCTKTTINPLLVIEDASAFAGTLTATNMKIVVGEPKDDYTGNLVTDNTITIESEKAMTIVSGKEFTAGNGITVDGTLTVNNGANQKTANKLTIGTTGVVNINKGDWFNFDATSRQNIIVKGTMNLGTVRQTLCPNNPITLYPGALITADETSTDNGSHLNFIYKNGNAATLNLVAEEGNEATEATVSAILGPQGDKVTINVAEGLTLNLTESNSSSTSMRQKGINKTGTGVLKIAGDYGTLDGLTLSEGTIVTTADAVLPMTEDETPVAKITAAEGETLYIDTVDGVTTYSLEEKYPTYVDEAHQEAYNTWVTTGAAAGVDLTTVAAEVAAEAFALNCAPNEVAAAKAAFKLDITIDANGTVHVTYPDGYNIEPVIKGATTVNGEYTDGVEGKKFFKAVITIPTAQN